MSTFITMPFSSSRRPRWYDLLGYVVAVLGVVLATGALWVAQPIINLGSVYLIYLVVVVAVAVGWGLPQGVLASVLAFLAANFFFIEPRFTFSVANFEDLLALIIFLGLATLTSQLVARLRREAEEARRGQQAANQAEVLRRTDALRVALLSAVAHDLRTPLTSIKTAATSLLNPRAEWSEEDRRDFLQSIVSQVDHINHLVSNLLDMSRIEEGRLRPNKEPHRIEGIIETVLERLQPTLAAHPVDSNIEPGIPDVLVDAVEIDEVLANLLENAARYTSPGTPVHIRARRVVNMVEVSVVDEGPGIPPESLPQLFHRFYRVMPGRGGTRGWGLGLAIVKGIVEAHGGSVSASNRPSGGAMFTFTLPLQPRAALEVEDEHTLPQPARSH